MSKTSPKSAPTEGGSLVRIGRAEPPRERRDAAENRERILKAAKKLLRRRPLADICMDKLAEEAGVGKGTLYRRFPDRAALVHALLDEDTRQLQDRALAGFGLPKDASPLEHVLMLLAEIFDFVDDHSALLLEAHAQAPCQRLEHPAYTWQRTLISARLREAMRRGELEPLDPFLTAELMLSTLSPDAVTWMTSSEDRAVAAKANLLDLWRRALRMHPAR
ncbi:MAG: TetR/AcrR family transcriptional regulator [Myxococcota bacterium]